MICGLGGGYAYTARMPIDSRRILFQDEHLLIVNKLAGELVVAADGEGKLPLFDFLKKDHPGLRVLHRLDYQTSGVIVFAKTAEVVEHVRTTKFEGWVKTYVALVSGRVEKNDGTIAAPLKARTHEGLVDATSHYRVLKRFISASFVEVRIDTGRKHQIRQHMASIGHPLFCDPLYGDKTIDRKFSRRFGYHKFFLHSTKLILPHPITGKIIQILAPLPPAFEEILRKLSQAGLVAATKPVEGKRTTGRTYGHHDKRKSRPQRRGPKKDFTPNKDKKETKAPFGRKGRGPSR